MPYYKGTGDCMYGRGDYYRGDYYRGDPFSLKSAFGGLVKVGGALLTGGPSAAIATGMSLLSGGGSPKKPPLGGTPGISVSTYQPPMILPPAPNTAMMGTALAPNRPIVGFDATLGPIHGSFGIGGDEPVGGPGVQPSYSLTPSGMLVPCQMKGYHPNKSGYYRKGAYIPKGSVCVKTRRINVANPRALRRAIRRAHGFAKLARRVLSYPISKPPKGRALFKKRTRR